MQIIMNATRIGGSWSNWYEGMFKCGGFKAKDMICVKDLDAKFEQYQKSFDRDERKQLAEEIQRAILENHYFVPVFRHAFVNAIGPRIKAAEMAGRVPDDHHRLRLSVGGHPAEGSRRRAELGQGGRLTWSGGNDSVHHQADGLRADHAVHPQPDDLHGGQADRRPGDAAGRARRARRGSRPAARRVGARPLLAGAIRQRS